MTNVTESYEVTQKVKQISSRNVSPEVNDRYSDARLLAVIANFASNSYDLNRNGFLRSHVPFYFIILAERHVHNSSICQ